MSGPGSPYRWALLAVCVAGFMRHAPFELVALAIAVFARETGRRAGV